jgi:hypothetical protein
MGAPTIGKDEEAQWLTHRRRVFNVIFRLFWLKETPLPILHEINGPAPGSVS